MFSAPDWTNELPGTARRALFDYIDGWYNPHRRQLRQTYHRRSHGGFKVTPRILKVLHSPDQARRVLIVERADGHYSLQVEKRYQNVFEGTLVAEGWQRLPDAPSVFQTVEIAEREAKTRFPWLSKDDHDLNQ